MEAGSKISCMSRADLAGQYILDRMRSELSGNLFYHNVSHVQDVVNAAEMIGKSEQISDVDLELLKVAAYFHDSGFIIQPDNHEKLSCDIATEYLPGIGFTQSEISIICKLIMATRVPQSPTNLLEQIICDADLDYLGRDDFFTIGNTIFQEFISRNVVASEKDWNELQVKFLTAHNYFTATSMKLRGPKKEAHLLQIKQILAGS